MPTTIYSPYRQSKSNTTVLSIIICILGGGVGCSLFLFGGLVNIFCKTFSTLTLTLIVPTRAFVEKQP